MTFTIRHIESGFLVWGYHLLGYGFYGYHLKKEGAREMYIFKLLELYARLYVTKQQEDSFNIVDLAS